MRWVLCVVSVLLIWISLEADILLGPEVQHENRVERVVRDCVGHGGVVIWLASGIAWPAAVNGNLGVVRLSMDTVQWSLSGILKQDQPEKRSPGATDKETAEKKKKMNHRFCR